MLARTAQVPRKISYIIFVNMGSLGESTGHCTTCHPFPTSIQYGDPIEPRVSESMSVGTDGFNVYWNPITKTVLSVTSEIVTR